MNAAVINIRTDINLKMAAQEVADNLGFSLSSLVNAYLKSLVKTKTVYYSDVEEPNEYLKAAIREAEEDLRLGRTSLGFSDAKSGIAWLKNKRRNYVGKVQ